jgi:glycosyltransferase involved in cell wall biosynthesis
VILSVNIPTTYAAVERMRARGEEAPYVAMTNHAVQPQYLADAKAWAHVLDAMIGTNRLLHRLAEEFTGMDSSRLYYAPCGVPLPAECIVPERAAGPLRIGYAGRLEAFEKRANDLPEILLQLDRLQVDYECRVAGSGPLEAMLKQRLRSGMESGRVQFLGVLGPADLNARLYGWADALLVTSCCETGPIVIWEAMAQGLPVVSSRYVGSGLEGSLRDGENCLLFPIGNAEAAALQLARLVDPALRASLTACAHRLVAARYTRERSVEMWDACLRSILQQPRRQTSGRPTPVTPAGRLDRWLGTGPAEGVRRLLGQSFMHADPGGEWPHAAGGADMDQTDFWRRAQELDAPLSDTAD